MQPPVRRVFALLSRGRRWTLLVTERVGFSPTIGDDQPELKEMIDQLTRDSLDALRKPTTTTESDLVASA